MEQERPGRPSSTIILRAGCHRGAKALLLGVHISAGQHAGAEFAALPALDAPQAGFLRSGQHHSQSIGVIDFFSPISADGGQHEAGTALDVGKNQVPHLLYVSAGGVGNGGVPEIIIFCVHAKITQFLGQNPRQGGFAAAVQTADDDTKALFHISLLQWEIVG